MKTGRFWYYPSFGPHAWMPALWTCFGVPHLSSDEFGRKVIIWGTFLTGWLCFAYADCYCEDCVDVRVQLELDTQHREMAEKYGDDFADDWLDYQVRMREVPGDGTRRV